MLGRREHICLLVLKLSLTAQQIIQGGLFTAPAQTVLSVEDCKIPNKKVKVGLAFPFLVGTLQSSTLGSFWAGSVKKTPCTIHCYDSN